MNETTIVAVANAITANAEVLKALIESLSAEQKQAVEKNVGKSKDTPAVTPVATPAPAPVAAAPMPAAPFPTAPVAPATATPAPIPVAPQPVTPPQATVFSAPVSVSPSSPAPFTDQPSLMQWMMAQYQAMGPAKGARIQECLNALGVKSVGEVQPHQYAQLAQMVETLKASA